MYICALLCSFSIVLIKRECIYPFPSPHNEYHNRKALPKANITKSTINLIRLSY